MVQIAGCLAVLAVLLAAADAYSSCGKHYHRNEFIGKKSGDISVDFLLFVQQWAPGYCMSTRQGCSVPSGDPRWTMHGLWPTSNHSEGPNSCTQDPFVFNTISDLVPALNSSWPDLLISSPYYCFWEHEWSKHGTCAEDITPLSGEHAYFKGVMDIRSNMDFISALSLAGIKPGSSYKGSDIQQALRNAFSADPIVQCYHYEGSYVLVQMGLCLSKTTFKPFQCSQDVYKESTCPLDASVQYLAWQ